MKDTIPTQPLLKKLLLKYLSLAFFGALILVSIKSTAQGDLLLYPKRIVFEGAKRSQTLNIANNGKDTARYFISVVQMKMKEDGSFETISQPDSGQDFADKNFRFFPRNVVLAPNEAQSVKIQLVNTNDMLPGEYRSHIYFRAEADKKPLGEKDAIQDSGSISVNVIAVFVGTSIYHSVYSIAIASIAPTIVAIVMTYHPLNNYLKFNFFSIYTQFPDILDH